MPIRRWSPSRRAFFRSTLVRPAMLVAIILAFWGHVILFASAWRALTLGVDNAIGSLFEGSADTAAGLVNAVLAGMALVGWALVGVGFVQRRRRGPDDADLDQDPE